MKERRNVPWHAGEDKENAESIIFDSDGMYP